MTNAQHSTTTNENAGVEATSPSTALWRIAVSEYEAALAEYRIADERHTEANRAYADEMGGLDPELVKYSLHYGPRYAEKAREDVIFHIAQMIAMSEHVGERLSAEDYSAVMAKAATLVDEGNAYKLKDREASARLTHRAQQEFDAALDKLATARAKLVHTPAPDAAAIREKINVLLPYLREVDSDDVEDVAAVFADALRLTGAE
jgi:hypothetical protein